MDASASLLRAAACAGILLAASSCNEKAPLDFGRTPDGPGARVRFDLGHQPLPDIPLPNDSATWSDPTSRTGLRINASLLAPTAIERDARDRFDQLEGWGTFSPLTISFDLESVGGEPRTPAQAALDLRNIAERHHGDDYDFENDAIYLVNLTTGVPVPLDVGNGNFELTLKRLDRYWANDTRASERNLVFDTIDETSRGSIDRATFSADLDSDFDGVLDVPNLDDPFVCPAPDLVVCDNQTNEMYGSAECFETRRQRDRCIADHLLTYYERETDTLIVRPLIPLEEMTKYAVVLTDRLVDANGDAIKSPFDHVFHATQRMVGENVMKAIDDPAHAAYWGDLAGTGLEHVAFTWGFTTQPTIDDMKRLRDGLYGQGTFARLGKDYPAQFEIERAVGKASDLAEGATDPAGWESDPACVDKADNLYIMHIDEIRDTLELAVSELFGSGDGPDTQLLLKTFDNIDYIAVGRYKTPFFLEGGPDSTDPKAAFNLDFVTGAGEITSDEVQFFLVVPKETGEFHQPFDVAIYGHGYTGPFIEGIIYAGNMAEHGLATIGINAMGHGLVLDDAVTETLAKSIFAGACGGPIFDALLETRARDLNGDGRPDSGGDFWSSYLFHTRDGVRQSVMDHLQLVRILRTFGQADGKMLCQNASTGWDAPASDACDTNGDGTSEVAGDFDGDGTPDIGGPDAHYATWGESLGGILSGIHGAIDAYVTSAAPGSGGGGLTDIGVRSFQGGVIEAVLLRWWGPLLVSLPSEERATCTGALDDDPRCTICKPGEVTVRWVMPDVNDTGELEIACKDPNDLKNTTVLAYNSDNGELRCASVGDDARLRVGLPTTVGDRVLLSFYDGVNMVENYDSCTPTFDGSDTPRTTIDSYGTGRFSEGFQNGAMTASCDAPTCGEFQGAFFGEGASLVAPAEGYGLIRQTPALRRFIQLAQMALDPGDPITFAPYYALRQMTDPFGAPIAAHAVLTTDTIGDMNVPLNAGIAFARATGALPFFRPEQLDKYPEYVDYVTPNALFEALGSVTPNQDLINRHVVEGIAALARHPAQPACVTSANADLEGTYETSDGDIEQCFPTGCFSEGGDCPSHSYCDETADRCLPEQLGQQKCDEALFDADDLDEGAQLYFEQTELVPHRLVRYAASAKDSSIDHVWQPRLDGQPYGADGAWTPTDERLTALIDAYIVPEGVHTFVNGNPCDNFDSGTYMTNLLARFFQTDGKDVYYVSHPSSHHCLAKDAAGCDYLGAP